MIGVVVAVTDTGGTIQSETPVSCPYTFTREQFVSDWDALRVDMAAGTPIRVVFARRELGIAFTVRRLR